MWDQLSVLCALLCVVFSAPLTSTPCPEYCECVTLTSGLLEARCTSLNFLEKLQPKEVNGLISLDLSHRNITKLHSKLKKLRNLKTVDLSNNEINDISTLRLLLPKLTNLNLNSNSIKHFTAANLPGQLIKLDISHNYVSYIPQGLHKLSELKEVNLEGNPIACSCDTIKERDLLGGILVKPVICHAPEKLKGQMLQKVRCNAYDYLDQMQGDEPVDGSGDDDAPDIFDDVKTSANIPGIEDEGLIPQSPTTDATYTEEDGTEVEGSGYANTTEEEDDDYYEGSGFDEFTSSTVIPLKACNFDCSSPSPTNATDSGEPDPDISDEFKRAFGLLPEASTTEEPVSDVPIIAVNVDKTDAGLAQPDEKEKIADADEIKEDKASWNTNLIIVVALIALMLCLTVYSIMKKRKKRQSVPRPIEQEMKPLQSKPTNGNSNIPEKVPLMNGKNGNMNGKPVEEPVTYRRNEELDSKAPPEDEVDLRKKKDEESLLPETHRVTIQAKELTTPKTPLLVTRSRTGDGDFITTPEPH